MTTEHRLAEPLAPDVLAAIGVELYGVAWKAPLAEALEVNERSIRRWVAGTAPIPPSVPTELRALIHSKCDQLEDLLAELREQPEG